MGFGLPAALGVKTGLPEETVVWCGPAMAVSR
ncbi:hypothetical protein DMH17_13765 [Raoultella planticola]|nr:hypothetical protein [Raoultella planticola]